MNKFLRTRPKLPKPSTTLNPAGLIEIEGDDPIIKGPQLDWEFGACCTTTVVTKRPKEYHSKILFSRCTVKHSAGTDALVVDQARRGTGQCRSMLLILNPKPYTLNLNPVFIFVPALCQASLAQEAQRVLKEGPRMMANNMGVSENRGPEYSTLNSRILIILTPK